jgi:protein involved in polysaccharide export with SLBB domain
VSEITVDISGEVINPGVYKLPDGGRIGDLLVAAG